MGAHVGVEDGGPKGNPHRKGAAGVEWDRSFGFEDDLQTERRFKSHLVNGKMATGDGPIKTFPLRGVKDSPPYLHDGRLLTLEDTVEFFNLILELQLTPAEKSDLAAFMRVL